MDRFQLASSYQPQGDQPKAIRELVQGIEQLLVLPGDTPLGVDLQLATPSETSKKLLTDGWPARSTCSSLPSTRTLHRPQIRISGLAPRNGVGNSSTVEKTLAVVLESWPVHGDFPPSSART